MRMVCWVTLALACAAVAGCKDDSEDGTEDDSQAGAGNAAGVAGATGDSAHAGTAGDAGREAGMGGDSGKAPSTGCVGDEADAAPPESVEPSGLQGAIAELSEEQMQAFCDWLWALPGYGDRYCCEGVVRPLQVTVVEDDTPETCLQNVQHLAECSALDVEAYESCAIDKLGRVCGTPAGCFAFGHGALTSTCLEP